MVTIGSVNEIQLTNTGVSFSFVRTDLGVLKISKGIGHCPMVLETANGIGNSQWYWKQPMVLEMSDDVDGATVLEFYITVTILIASFR